MRVKKKNAPVLHSVKSQHVAEIPGSKFLNVSFGNYFSEKVKVILLIFKNFCFNIFYFCTITCHW